MFVLVFYLCSSQSFLNLNLLWSQDENRAVNPEAHSTCLVSVLPLTICQLSAHLIMICLLNENMLVLTTIQLKILQYRFFFFLLHLILAAGVWSLLLPSMTLILVTPHWVRITDPGCWKQYVTAVFFQISHYIPHGYNCRRRCLFIW